MKTTLVLQILNSWMFNDLVKTMESYEGAPKHGDISRTHKTACHPTTQLAPNPSSNSLRESKTDGKKTTSNPGSIKVDRL